MTLQRVLYQFHCFRAPVQEGSKECLSNKDGLLRIHIDSPDSNGPHRMQTDSDSSGSNVPQPLIAASDKNDFV